jgi:hypothetical protein
VPVLKKVANGRYGKAAKTPRPKSKAGAAKTALKPAGAGGAVTVAVTVVGGACVNIRSGKPSYITLVDPAGSYSAASSITGGQVTSVVGGGVWSAKAKFNGNTSRLPIRLKCTTRPSGAVVTPTTGELTIPVDNGTPPPDPVPVTYVDDDPAVP